MLKADHKTRMTSEHTVFQSRYENNTKGQVRSIIMLYKRKPGFLNCLPEKQSVIEPDHFHSFDSVFFDV